MEPELLPNEVILISSHQNLGRVKLDWQPQPGSYIEFQGQTYAVLERHHHYQYKIGGYCLHKVSLHVQIATQPSETSFTQDGRSTIGDASCQFNALSEILRCSVNPHGPCAECRDYQPRNKVSTSPGAKRLPLTQSHPD